MNAEIVVDDVVLKQLNESLYLGSALRDRRYNADDKKKCAQGTESLRD